jgi:hypothetical protein
MVWMGLEITGEDVPRDLALIHCYRRDLTAVSYEQYELGAGATLTLIPGISNVTATVESDGLQAWPLSAVSVCGGLYRFMKYTYGCVSGCMP